MNKNGRCDVSQMTNLIAKVKAKMGYMKDLVKFNKSLVKQHILAMAFRLLPRTLEAR